MKRMNSIILGMVCLLFSIHMTYGQGARYTGDYKKSQALQYVRKNNIIIEGLEFSDIDGDVIGLYNCENVIIRNNKFSSSNKRGIYLYGCKNVTIIDNTFENVHTALTASTSQGVKFEYNDVYNLGGPLAESDDTDNGFATLFIQVTGAGNSISYNAVENIFGESSPGDLINVNQSHGTPESPIRVNGNWIRGGGPSSSGGGILLGDLGGSYQIAEDNILVDPGQYGMGIAGGHSMTLRNNKVYAKQQYFTNVGFSLANWYESQIGSSHSITFEGNVVNYTNRDGVKGNSWWIYQNMEPVKGKETNRYDPNLTASILPDKIIGRARDNQTPPPSDGGSTPLPPEEEPTPPKEEQTPPKEEPTPPKEEPTPPKEEPTPPYEDLDHSTIRIYKDKFNRFCVNAIGPLQPSAGISVLDVTGKEITEKPILGFHTVINEALADGTYRIYVENGNRKANKELTID